MKDLLEFGSSWLQQQRIQHLSRLVLYRRGNSTVEVHATIGRTILELDDGVGATIQTQVRDYLIDVSDLVLEGQPVLPVRGDRIEETELDQTFVYEVMPIGKEPHWRYSDPYRQTLRIHTKLILTERN